MLRKMQNDGKQTGGEENLRTLSLYDRVMDV
jgi:hypothetical protein